jgi:hypothetical protein
MISIRRLLVLSATFVFIGGSAAADGFNMDGNWVKLGKVTASHTVDHDKIRVEGRNDDFRKLKFRVTDSPVNMHRIVVTYDNGPPETLEIRENIGKGGETRQIDLRGGSRSIRTIEFWYDTMGLLNGKAEVIAYGKH